MTSDELGRAAPPAHGREPRGPRTPPPPRVAAPAARSPATGRRRRARRPLLHPRPPRRCRRHRASPATPIDDAIAARCCAASTAASTHTFFSYRIAETLARHGPFAGNPLLAGLHRRRTRRGGARLDSSDWLALLDTDLLPRNYAAVLARCELARQRARTRRRPGPAGRARRPHRRGCSARTRAGYLDDSNAPGRSLRHLHRRRLALLRAARRPPRAAVGGGAARPRSTSSTPSARPTAPPSPWGRSTGALGAALTVELAALALAERARRGRPRPSGSAGRGRHRGRSTAAFDADGVSNAHQHRDQDEYRGPARRLQLTLDLLGKLAWAAKALARRSDAGARRRRRPTPYPHDDELVRLRGAPRRRRCGRTAAPAPTSCSRSSARRRSHYLPAPHQPGTWEVPVDQDLPCWTPLVVAGPRPVHRRRRARRAGHEPAGGHGALGRARRRRA